MTRMEEELATSNRKLRELARSEEDALMREKKLVT